MRKHDKMSISLPSDMAKRIKAKAKKLGISVSALIALIIAGEAKL